MWVRTSQISFYRCSSFNFSSCWLLLFLQNKKLSLVSSSFFMSFNVNFLNICLCLSAMRWLLWFLFLYFFCIGEPSLFTAWLKWNFCGVSVLSLLMFWKPMKPRMSIYHDTHYVTVWSDGGDGDTMPHKQTVTKTVRNIFLSSRCLQTSFLHFLLFALTSQKKKAFYLLLSSRNYYYSRNEADTCKRKRKKCSEKEELNEYITHLYFQSISDKTKNTEKRLSIIKLLYSLMFIYTSSIYLHHF